MESTNNTTQRLSIITDAAGSMWAIACASSALGGQVSKNGIIDSATAQVTLLIYNNHVVYHQNQAGNFYAWSGSSWSQSPDPRIAVTGNESASNATVSSSGQTLIDSTGTKWTLIPAATGGLQVAVNGVPDTTTALVTLLLYNGHRVFQQNSAGGWWYKSKSTDTAWNSSNDPRIVTQPTPAGTSGAPQQAMAAGYSKLVFGDEFDSPSSIAPNQTASGNYKWWFCGATQASDFTVKNSMLTIMTDHTGYGADLQTVPTNAPASPANGTWQHGYFEARIQFDPNGYSGGGAWPAFWSWAIQAQNCFQGQQTAELDFMEAYPKQPGQAHSGVAFITTMHNWNNTSSGATNGGGYQSSPNMPNQQPDNNFHIYGCLWTPNKVQFYYDNQLCTYANGGPNFATGPGSPLTALEQDHMFITLGTGTNWPMQVDYVHVWQ